MSFPLWSVSSSAEYELVFSSDISSLPDPASILIQVTSLSSSLLLSLQSGCMDPTPLNDGSISDQTQLPIEARQSDASLGPQPLACRSTSQQCRTSPLAQTEGSDVPLRYRPRDWIDPNAEQASYPDPHSYEFEWRLHHPVLGGVLAARNQPDEDEHKQHRRPRRLREMMRDIDDERSHSKTTDYARLYPQMSPDEARYSTFSAPDQLGHTRSVSQPNSPNFPPIQHDEDGAPRTMMPRPPTYPPSGRRRVKSAATANDVAFNNPEEYCLFVQATAGLGPEEAAFRPAAQHAPSPGTSQRLRQQLYIEEIPPFHHSNRHPSGPSGISPIESGTPTTMQAYHEMAQMPENRQSHSSLLPLPARSRHSELPSDSIALSYHQQIPSNTNVMDISSLQHRITSSPSGLDLWISPPPTDPLGVADLSPIHDDYDELPDYAESQAQAQAGQRVGAARRAEELQRRWRQSSANR